VLYNKECGSRNKTRIIRIEHITIVFRGEDGAMDLLFGCLCTCKRHIFTILLAIQADWGEKRCRETQVLRWL